MSAEATNHSQSTSGQGLGLAYQIPADAYHHLVRTLRLTLPPPPSDNPEDLVRRDHAAIARIAALAPANAAEAELAAQFVAASEQWKDCLRLAQAPDTTPDWAAKCRGQASSMMRQANSALRLLLRMQETRRKLEADNVSRDRMAWTEHCALALMAEALTGHSEQPCPVPDAKPQPAADQAADPVSAAEDERAALIRRIGRPPENVSFGPPDDAAVQALIEGHDTGGHDRRLRAPNGAFPAARAA